MRTWGATVLRPYMRLPGDRFAIRRSIGAMELDQVEAGEEVGDFEGGGVGSVGAVGAVGADAGAEIVADCAGSGFLGVGGSHGVAPFGDAGFGFENHRDDFAGGHEVGEFAKEGAGFVDGVEAAGFFFGEAHGFDGDDREAGFVDAREDVSLLIGLYRIGFDNRKRTFSCHLEFLQL